MSVLLGFGSESPDAVAFFECGLAQMYNLSSWTVVVPFLYAAVKYAVMSKNAVWSKPSYHVVSAGGCPLIGPMYDDSP